MWNYVNRLIRCGFAPHTAYCFYWDFVKNFTESDLENFISGLEKDLGINDVDQIQS